MLDWLGIGRTEYEEPPDLADRIDKAEREASLQFDNMRAVRQDISNRHSRTEVELGEIVDDVDRAGALLKKALGNGTG